MVSKQIRARRSQLGQEAQLCSIISQWRGRGEQALKLPSNPNLSYRKHSHHQFPISSIILRYLFYFPGVELYFPCFSLLNCGTQSFHFILPTSGKTPVHPPHRQHLPSIRNPPNQKNTIPHPIPLSVSNPRNICCKSQYWASTGS
jgi:hypothetical protein